MSDLLLLFKKLKNEKLSKVLHRSHTIIVDDTDSDFNTPETYLKVVKKSHFEVNKKEWELHGNVDDFVDAIFDYSYFVTEQNLLYFIVQKVFWNNFGRVKVGVIDLQSLTMKPPLNIRLNLGGNNFNNFIDGIQDLSCAIFYSPPTSFWFAKFNDTKSERFVKYTFDLEKLEDLEIKGIPEHLFHPDKTNCDQVNQILNFCEETKLLTQIFASAWNLRDLTRNALHTRINRQQTLIPPMKPIHSLKSIFNKVADTFVVKYESIIDGQQYVHIKIDVEDQLYSFKEKKPTFQKFIVCVRNDGVIVVICFDSQSKIWTYG